MTEITILLLIFCRFLTTPAGKRDVFGGDTQKHASSSLNKGITMKRTTIKRHSIQFTLAAALTLAAHSACAAVGTLSGPYTHRNLEIFLVHGDTQLEERRYATLGEAMAKRYVVIHETGNVNELTIENLSKTVVYLNAGDIVKGGRQDRTAKDDLILPPLSGKIALAAFCVEHGRWTGRANDNAAAFSANTYVLSSKELKLASRYKQNQAEVWSRVDDQQGKLSSNVSSLAGKTVDTRSPASASSLQLTLENKDLESVKQPYLDKLKPTLDGKTDVIGFVCIINGQINCAEIYNNKALFRALWPKLLDAAITEAIADYQPKGAADQPSVAAVDVKAFFQTAVSGSIEERSVSKSTRVKTCSTPTTILFETIDTDADNVWIHKSFIAKTGENVSVPLDRNRR
jgi:hypothetical protein